MSCPLLELMLFFRLHPQTQTIHIYACLLVYVCVCVCVHEVYNTCYVYLLNFAVIHTSLFMFPFLARSDGIKYKFARFEKLLDFKSLRDNGLPSASFASLPYRLL